MSTNRRFNSNRRRCRMMDPILSREIYESRSALPRLVDIINWAQNGDADEQLYFSRFGFSTLEIPEDCPHILARKEELEGRFNDRYLFRRISQETMPRWQFRLQVRMDAIARRYERAYALYEQYQQQMDNDMIEGEVEVKQGVKSRLSGKDSTSSATTESASGNSTDKVIDTPDSAINASDDYADSLSKSNSSSARNASGSGETEYGRQDDVDLTTTKTYTGKQIMENINLSIQSWFDIDTALIGEFENLFLNIFE